MPICLWIKIVNNFLKLVKTIMIHWVLVQKIIITITVNMMIIIHLMKKMKTKTIMTKIFRYYHLKKKTLMNNKTQIMLPLIFLWNNNNINHNNNHKHLIFNKQNNRLKKKNKKFYIKLKDLKKEVWVFQGYFQWQVVYKKWKQNFKGLKKI